MSTVVFFSYPLFGHTNYGAKLAKKLTENGENVYYYGGNKYKTLIESKGVCFRAYQNIDNMIAATSREPLVDGLDAYWSMGEHLLTLCDDIYANDLDSIKALNPDYLIYDPLALWGMRIARQLNIPAIASVTGYAFNEKMLELNPDCFIRNGLMMQDHPFFINGTYQTLKRVFDMFSSNLNRKFGIADYHITDNFYGHEDLNIMYTCKAFQLHAETFDERCVFVGPAIDELDLNIDVSEFLRKGKITIYISMGTIYTEQKEFYQGCFDLFRNTDYHVLMSVGMEMKIDEMGEIPENVIVKNTFPQIALLKEIDIFISHGGANSAREAMYFGVPMIVFPQAGDHFLVAEDIERLRLGKYLRETSQLKAAIEAILTNDEYTNNCKTMASAMREAGGLERAYEVIKEFKRKKGIR